MKVKAKDKRIKALDQVPATTADEDLNVVGLQPGDAALIRSIVTELRAFPNVAAAGLAHEEWDLHHWKPRKAASPWSISVSGQWRLLFEYDKTTHDITGLRLAQPH